MTNFALYTYTGLTEGTVYELAADHGARFAVVEWGAREGCPEVLAAFASQATANAQAFNLSSGDHPFTVEPLTRIG